MQTQSIQPERRLERAILLGLLVTWGVASVTTLAYQQLVKRDPTEKLGAETERLEFE
jgi:hypothetical protein